MIKKVLSAITAFTLLAIIAIPYAGDTLVPTVSPAWAQETMHSDDLARFVALMQYIRSQPTPADVKADSIPLLSTLDTALSKTYITGFITPYTGETPEQVNARLQPVPEEDRFIAVMVESYRLADDPLLLNIIHRLLPLYYVQFFTTADDLNASTEFLKRDDIESLAAAFDSSDYTIPAPTVTGTASPSPTPASKAQSGNGKYDADSDGLIEISNLEQLNAIRYDLNGDGNPDSDSDAVEYGKAFPTGAEAVCNNCNGYELTRPLDFKEVGSYAAVTVNTAWTTGKGWSPIGDSDDPFLAIFDGNGHAISNLYVFRVADSSYDSAVGLFGFVGGSSAIRGVGLLDVNVSGGYNVGGLAGDNSGKINDSYTTGSVLGKEWVGGLSGRNSGTISDSHSATNVSGSKDFPDQYAGGLTGWNRGAISDSYATGNVSGYYDVGGLTGANTGPSSSISVSYAIGNVKGDDYVGGLTGSNRGTINVSYATGSVSGGSEVGGLVGSNPGTISASYATGNVQAYHDVGGLVGNNPGTISASYATGSVSSSGINIGGEHSSGIGGLAGVNQGVISASYAKGSVSGRGVTVGGLVGANPGAIVSSYATGRVSSSSEYEYVGGLIGSNSGKVQTSFWDIQTSGYESGVGDGDSTGVEGKTTAQLQAPTGYDGIYSAWAGADDFWDFGTSSQYPALKVDFDGDGVATWQEFGKQRGRASPPPSS